MYDDYFVLGPVPAGEECAQVGDPEYAKKNREEATKYIQQLLRRFGKPPIGAKIHTKAFRHDFGTYHEVVCSYDSASPDGEEYCADMEANTPEYWDDDDEV